MQMISTLKEKLWALRIGSKLVICGVAVKIFEEGMGRAPMAGYLSQSEADKLITMLKRTIEERIYFPSQKDTLSFMVVGERRDDEFVVNIDRKGKNAEKCTYQGRVHRNNQVLMRLDIDPNGKHTNPAESGGEVILGNHLHIYTEEYEMKYAIPFDIENKDLYELCFTFFEKFHIIKPPAVFYQATI